MLYYLYKDEINSILLPYYFQTAYTDASLEKEFYGIFWSEIKITEFHLRKMTAYFCR